MQESAKRCALVLIFSHATARMQATKQIAASVVITCQC